MPTDRPCIALRNVLLRFGLEKLDAHKVAGLVVRRFRAALSDRGASRFAGDVKAVEIEHFQFIRGGKTQTPKSEDLTILPDGTVRITVEEGARYILGSAPGLSEPTILAAAGNCVLMLQKLVDQSTARGDVGNLDEWLRQSHHLITDAEFATATANAGNVSLSAEVG